MLIAVALGNLLDGLPINASQNYPGPSGTCCSPTDCSPDHPGADLPVARRHIPVLEDHRRHARAQRAPGPPGDSFTGATVMGFVIWTHVTHTTEFVLNPIELLAVIAAVWLVYEHRPGFALVRGGPPRCGLRDKRQRKSTGNLGKKNERNSQAMLRPQTPRPHEAGAQTASDGREKRPKPRIWY
jgi:hypothetical protein